MECKIPLKTILFIYLLLGGAPLIVDINMKNL